MSQVEIKIDQITKLKDQQSQLHNADICSAKDKNTALKKVAITTLGCKVNTYESELIAETLQTKDWDLVMHDECADLYLINTCTVTKEADRQARQAVRKVIKKNPEALVVVTGCYAQIDPDACAQIPGVDLVLGNDRKLDIHQLLPELEKSELPQVMVGDLDQHISLPDQLLTSFEARTDAFVQIQQGCDQGCTFCIIHVARGPSRSLPPSLIKRQVQRLVLNGYPEIVICGVDLGSYGADLSLGSEQFDLTDLLNELLALEHDENNPFRIRISSIDPHHMTERFINLVASEPRICPHIHLSMQSGSNLILKRMKRRYSAEQMCERIESLRIKMPSLVISADVMVGFPTETEEHFLQTEQVLKRLKIAFPHTFSYSERTGTPAARIPQDRQVPVATRKARNKKLRSLGKTIHHDLLKEKLGQVANVLPEQQAKREGYTLCRAEDYLAVLVPSTQIRKGQWQSVAYQSIDGDYLIGDLLG